MVDVQQHCCGGRGGLLRGQGAGAHEALRRQPCGGLRLPQQNRRRSPGRAGCRIDRSHYSAGIARTRVNRTLRMLARRSQEIATELKAVRERRQALYAQD